MELESKIKRLDEISKSLEQNNLSIDESMKLFEEGTKLLKECYDAIGKAEGKIVSIKADLDAVVEKDFKPEN